MRVSPRRAAARSAPVDKGSLVHKPKSLSASMQKRFGHVLSREDADLIFQPRKTLEGPRRLEGSEEGLQERQGPILAGCACLDGCGPDEGRQKVAKRGRQEEDERQDQGLWESDVHEARQAGPSKRPGTARLMCPGCDEPRTCGACRECGTRYCSRCIHRGTGLCYNCAGAVWPPPTVPGASSDGNFYTKAEGQFEWIGCLEVDHRILLSDDNLNRHCIPKDELQRLGRKWKTKRRFIYKFTSVVKFQEPKFLCSQKPLTEWFSFEPEALLLPQT